MKGKSIAGNTLALFAMNAASAVLTLVLTVFAARYLGEAGFGRYSFALAFTSLFVVFVPVGLDVLLAREVARKRSLAARFLGNALSMHIVSSVLAFALMAGIVNLLAYPLDTRMAVYLMGFYVIFTSFGRLFKSVFQGFERMDYQAGVDFLSKAAIALLGVIVLFKGYGLVALCAVFVLGGLLDFLLGYVLVRRSFTPMSLEADTKYWGELLSQSFPIFLAYAFAMIYYKIDIFILSVLKGDAAVGVFSAPFRLMEGLTIIPTSILVSLFPVLSRLHMSNRKSAARLYDLSIAFLVSLGLPIALGTTLLAEPIVGLFFGQAYSGSVQVLVVLVWAEFFLFLNNATGNMLKCVNRQGAHMWIIFSAAVANIVLNLLLIPSYGIMAAAYVALFTEFFVAACWFVYLRGVGYPFNSFGRVLKAVVGCALMVAAIGWLGPFGLLPTIALSGMLYVAVLLALGAFKWEELEGFFRGE